MRERTGRALAMLIVALAAWAQVSGGELRDLERDVTQEDHSGPAHGHGDRDHDEWDYFGPSGASYWDGSSDNWVLIVPIAMIAGGVHSWQSVAHTVGTDVEPRRPNEPLIPFFRGDVSYLPMSGDIDAWDARVEAGYGPFAVEYDLLSLEEDTGDELEVRRVCALYRMSFGKRVEVDLGIGSMTLEGADRHSEMAFTTPVLVWPTDRWGIEFRPAWARFEGSTLQDYDLGFFVNWRGVGLKAGYRWLRSDNEDIRGTVGSDLNITIRLMHCSSGLGCRRWPVPLLASRPGHTDVIDV